MGQFWLSFKTLQISVACLRPNPDMRLLDVPLLLVLLTVSQPTTGESSCQHTDTTLTSFCTGCPPMFQGKPCASTTRYFDLTKGACGCGTEPNPPDFWTKAKFAAAGNAMMIDDDQPNNSWCCKNCGLCFRLCSTGGTTNGTPPPSAGECRVFQLENRCGDGYPGTYLCGQKLSPWQCLANPAECAAVGNTNMFGYPAHFDLQDVSGQVSDGLGWNNVEVTFEQVDCSEGDFGDWDNDCYCPHGI